MPGAVLAGTRYRVIRKLGDGGMGTVYEAEHLDIERRVALKILRPEFTQTPQIVELFRAEARAASKVGSEHIAQVFDFAELPDGSVMFTMELVHGPTLREELRDGPITVSRSIALLRQICKGLDAAHKAGVVHRDVKPDNIVIEQRGGRADAIKILDFGIAAMMGDERRPVAAGTPHYSAPEVVAGAKFDRRADVYAVGCTAYEMLVGRPPFARHGNDVEAVLGSHLGEVATPPSKARLDLRISPALDNVIMRCLAKLPSNRFRTMSDLEAALCAAQIDAALQTSWDDLPLPEEVDPELRERLLREMPDLHGPAPSRRHGGWIAAGIVAALGLGGLATYALVSAREPVVEQVSAPSAVDLLVAEARGAAARNAYVYPAQDASDQATAYTAIRQLDALAQRGDSREQARAAAELLRREFAETLVRQGDSFWDREGGRTFAVEYYREALLFDREHAHAKARAALGVEELDALATKAGELAFTPQELAAAQPLRRAPAGDRAAGSRTPQPGEPGSVADAGASGELAADTALPSVPGGVATDERNGAAELSVGAAKLLAAGHAADAEEMFKRALIYDPSNLAALQGLNGIAAKRGDHDTALEYAERLVANAPQRAQSHLLVGDAAFALEEFADAQRSWARAAALGSKSAAAKLVKFAAKLPTPPVEPPTPKPEPSAGAQAEPANSNDEPNVDPEGPDDAAPPAHVPGDDATTVSHG